MGISFKAGVAIDMTVIDFSNLLYGMPTTATESKFVLKYANGYRDQFEGDNFDYNKQGVPNGGRVESYTAFQYSKSLFSIEGLDVVVTALVKAAKTATVKDDYALIDRQLSGNDTVTGSAGDDVLFAGTGKDEIDGKGGRDTIFAGPGADTLSGGLGGDTFLFLARTNSTTTKAGRDTITDFGAGDTIDLSSIGGRDFVGDEKFSGDKGEVRFDKSGGDTFVQVDFNGDKKADFEIKLEGNVSLKASDFDF